MKNKKKEMLLIGLGIVSILVIIVGVTYAFFNYTKQGSTNNVIETGTIKFLYDEKYGYGNGIQIIDAVPMSDELGKAQKGNNQVFDFRIVSTTMSNTAIPYTITVKKYDSDLDDKFIKLYLTKVEGENEEELVLSKFNGEIGENYLDSYKGSTVEKILYKGNVPSGKTDYEINYRLRMWIDEDVDFSPEKDGNGNSVSGESPYNGQTFKIRVNVYANGVSLDEEGLANESKAEIKSFSLGGEEIDPSDTDSKLYEATLPEGTTNTTVDIETESEYASVKIEKTDSNYNSLTSMNTGSIERMSTKRTLPLTSGDNYFKITVTSEDKEKDEVYKLHISIRESIRIFGKAYEVNTATPTLTTTSQAANENGLYKSTETNSGNPTYYFRGAVDNNWVSFAGFKWRIVRINEDGSIRLILQNNIGNYQLHSSENSANDMYYSNWTSSSGYAKAALSTWYNNNINKVISGTDKKHSDYIAESLDGGYFCEEPKTRINSDAVSGISGVDMELCGEYTPSYKCENRGGYGKVNPSPNIGLITYDEVVMAGGGVGSINVSNFYLNSGDNFFTMSSAGYRSNGSNVWAIYNGFIGNTSPAHRSYTIRPVINLLADTIITKGNGTELNPFLITGSPEI